jgi:hypothetical protein
MHRSKQPGYWTLGRHPQYGDIDVHILTPLGPLVLSRFDWVPGYWVGILVLVMLHEVGHALLARRYGMRVTAIRLHGLGGHCAYFGAPTPWHRAVIAWGGVMMQGVLLLVALTWLFGAGRPQSAFLYHFQDAWLASNIFLIVLNLLPIDPLDGGQAWRALPMLRKRWQDRKRRAHLRVIDPGDEAAKPRGAASTKPLSPDAYAEAEAQRLWKEALRNRNKDTDKKSMH